MTDKKMADQQASLSTRLACYQHHITKARVMEALGGAQ